MADGSVVANPGAGGASFPVDQDGAGKSWPYTKLAFGASGTQTEVSAANPLPVSLANGSDGAPYQGTPLGYEQITGLGSAKGLTVPTGATFCVVTCETEGIRWRDDGTPPTATVGMPLQNGASLSYSGDLTAIQFIQQAAGAILNVSYYK